MRLPENFIEVIKMLEKEYKDLFEGLDDEAIVLLLKAIYGLVQAARQWFKKLSMTLIKKLSFRQSMKDPCLFYRQK